MHKNLISSDLSFHWSFCLQSCLPYAHPSTKLLFGCLHLHNSHLCRRSSISASYNIVSFAGLLLGHLSASAVYGETTVRRLQHVLWWKWLKRCQNRSAGLILYSHQSSRECHAARLPSPPQISRVSFQGAHACWGRPDGAISWSPAWTFSSSCRSLRRLMLAWIWVNLRRIKEDIYSQPNVQK